MWLDWQDFFSTLAQVSVTVFSIMFLAMQVRSKVWRRSRLFQVAAYSALTELFVPTLVAMVTLMAGHPWPNATQLKLIMNGGVLIPDDRGTGRDDHPSWRRMLEWPNRAG